VISPQASFKRVAVIADHGYISLEQIMQRNWSFWIKIDSQATWNNNWIEGCEA
jgi:hypothetical protein